MLPAAEHRPDRTGEHAAASVILQGQLPGGHPQLGRGVRLEDLLDLLQFDEVVGRADHAESQPGQMQHQTGQFAPEPVGAVVPVEVEAPGTLPPGAGSMPRRRSAAPRTRRRRVRSRARPERTAGCSRPAGTGNARGPGGRPRRCRPGPGAPSSARSAPCRNSPRRWSGWAGWSCASATATDEGSSMLDLWWKSGSTTGGAARSAPATVSRRSARAPSAAGICSLSNTRGPGWPSLSASRVIRVTSM